MTYPLIEPAIIAISKELMGDKFLIMMAYYLEDAQSYINVLQTETDISLAVNAAHTLKSSSMQVGAVALAKIAEYIEQRIETADMGVEINQLQPLFEQTKTAMREIC